MNEKDSKILKEILNQLNVLSSLSNYEYIKLLYALNHQISQLVYFYKDIAKNKSTERIFYKTKMHIKEHELVYINLGRGFPKEMNDGHWCYIIKNYGYKLLVIPTTSIKEDSQYNPLYDMDIVTKLDNHITKSRLSITDIRCVDIQRIDERKNIGKVLTKRIEINKFIKNKILDD